MTKTVIRQVTISADEKTAHIDFILATLSDDTADRQQAIATIANLPNGQDIIAAFAAAGYGELANELSAAQWVRIN